MFWLGLLIGLVIGGILGFIGFALVAGSSDKECTECQLWKDHISQQEISE